MSAGPKPDPVFAQVAEFMAAANPSPADVLGLANVVGRLARAAGLDDEPVAAAVLDGFHAPGHRPALRVSAGGPRLSGTAPAIP